MPEGEDPIIVKPGKYPGLKEGDPPREGVCVVIDDGNSWRMESAVDGRIIAEDDRLYFSVPVDGKFIIIDDFTPPLPDDPSVVENPPVSRKVKKAILRVNGDFTSMTFNGVSMRSEAKGELTISYAERKLAAGGGT